MRERERERDEGDSVCACVCVCVGGWMCACARGACAIISQSYKARKNHKLLEIILFVQLINNLVKTLFGADLRLVGTEANES